MVFQRDLTPINAFGITFATVGVLLVFSAAPLHYAIVCGGPVVMVWGWVVISALNVVTAMCLAEMAACMPAAVGSLYFFTARLAPWHSKAAATWISAWANLAAAVGTTALYALVTMRSLSSAARLMHIAASTMPYDAADASFSVSPGAQFGLYGAILLSWCGLASAPLVVTAAFITGTSLWQFFGGGALFISLLAVAPRKQSISYILSGWVTVPRISGIRSVPYNVLISMLFPITAQTGYETVLYFVEEMLIHRRRRGGGHRPRLGAAGLPGHPRGPQQQQQQHHHYHHFQPSHGALVAANSSQAGLSGGFAESADVDGGSRHMTPTGTAPLSLQLHPCSRRLMAWRRGPHGPGAHHLGWVALFRKRQLQQLQQSAFQQQQPGQPTGASGGGGSIRGGSGRGAWRSQSMLPESIYGGLAASCVVALAFIMLMLAAAPSLSRAVDPWNETLGKDPMSQIIYDVLKTAYGTGRGAPYLVLVLTVGTYGSGLVCTAGACRKLWAMASDGFVPSWLSSISSTSRVPVRATLLVTAAALAPGLLLFLQDWAVDAILSFVLLSMNVSYLIPVALRLLPTSSARYDASSWRVGQEGGFTLGRASRPLFSIALCWLLAGCLMALLPPAWPLAAPSANWAPVSSAALSAALAVSWWMPRWGARRWFRGLASVGGVSYG